MRERTNRHAWRACVGQLTVGSNPTPSAMEATTATVDDVAAMEVALVEAEAALVHGDVPVGAVVLHRGVVIAQRHNEREAAQDPTAHAEILALQDAAKARGTWRLDDCTLVRSEERRVGKEWRSRWSPG